MPYGYPLSDDQRIIRHESIYGCSDCTPPERQYQSQQIVIERADLSITNVTPDESKAQNCDIKAYVTVSGVLPLLNAVIRLEVENEYGNTYLSSSRSVPNGNYEMVVTVPLSSYQEGDTAKFTLRAQERDVGIWSTEVTKSHYIMVTETPVSPPISDSLEKYIEPAMWGSGLGAIIGMVTGKKESALEFAAVGAAAYVGYTYLTKPDIIY